MRTHLSPARNGSGTGRPSSRQAEATSHDLRHGAGQMLARRRRVFGFSLASAASLGVVAPYQAGILRSFPDPPGGVFDSDQVDAGGEAYSYLSTPDAALGIASYTLTAVLAGMGLGDRARTQPRVQLATRPHCAELVQYSGLTLHSAG